MSLIDITYRLPTLADEEILKDYVREHCDNGETSISASLGLTSMNYEDWVKKVNKMAIEANDDWGRSYLYLACLNDHLIGLINIRYEMSKDLQAVYGNIGYGVRPSARRMGFATEMLRYGLQICKEHGLDYAILGCIKDNIASARTMIRNGEQLIREGSGYKPDKVNQYFKFHLNKPDDMPEFWDLYDSSRNLTGKTHQRGVPIPNGYYHLVVHVWIKNSDGKYLISQRAATRASHPLKWECVGGSVLKGEDSLHGALREVKEEVGIELNPENGQVVLSRFRDVVDGKRFQDIMDAWLFEYDGEISLDNATTDEVTQARWMTVDEIKELCHQNNFVDTLSYFFEHIANL